MSLLTAQTDMAVKALERRIAQLENIKGGAGVVVHRRPGGISISATPAAASRPAKKDVSGDSKVLNCVQATQDTDTYDRSTDNVPVEFHVVTDIQYDDTTHKLTFRTRTITAVGITAISAESDLVEVFTAEECS